MLLRFTGMVQEDFQSQAPKNVVTLEQSLYRLMDTQKHLLLYK